MGQRRVPDRLEADCVRRQLLAAHRGRCGHRDSAGRRALSRARLANFVLLAFVMRAPAVHSPSLYERPGYRTLLGRIRNNVRLYIRKQLELPRQEIAEIVQANLRAAMWFGIAFAFVMGTLIALTVLVIAVIAIWLPLWAAALIVFALFIALAALTGYIGYKKLDLRGPTRSINSLKETMRWAKARLLGRSAS
jgi:uncharacterized membrane protein YqjE